MKILPKIIIMVLLPLLSFSQIIKEEKTSLTFIIDGEEKKFIRDIKIEYYDKGFCTDITLIELIFDNGDFIILSPLKYGLSCGNIINYNRIKSKDDYDLLLNKKLIFIRVQNPQTENIYYHMISEDNQKYLMEFLKTYKY